MKPGRPDILQFLEYNREKAKISFKDFTEQRGFVTEIYELDLEGLDFSNLDFSDTRITRSNLKNIDFSNSNFKDCCFYEIMLENNTFKQTCLESAYFSNSALEKVTVDGSNLTNTTFECGSLTNIVFINSNLYGIKFKRIRLNRLCFKDICLDNSLFQNVALIKPNFENSSLTNTTFKDILPIDVTLDNIASNIETITFVMGRDIYTDRDIYPVTPQPQAQSVCVEKHETPQNNLASDLLISVWVKIIQLVSQFPHLMALWVCNVVLGINPYWLILEIPIYYTIIMKINPVAITRRYTFSLHWMYAVVGAQIVLSYQDVNNILLKTLVVFGLFIISLSIGSGQKLLDYIGAISSKLKLLNTGANKWKN